MSILALTLTLCSAIQCDDYMIDHALPEQMDVCHSRLVEESEEFGDAWVAVNANERIARYLGRFNIEIDPRFIVDYDFTCQSVEEDDIP